MNVRFSSLALVSLIAAAACRAKPSGSAVEAAASAVDTTDCGFVAKAGHDKPDSLLSEYLKRDGDGEFTQSDDWRDEAMACPNHAPGWDGFTLISTYKYQRLAADADTARYLVSYTRMGMLEQDSAGFLFRADSAQERDTVILARTPYGWRIGDWDDEPHLLPAGAVKLPTLKESDRKLLQSLTPPGR